MASATIGRELTGKGVQGRELRRWVAAAAVLTLALVFSGDRAQTAGTVQGIDPLEILNLQVKPNVIIVLDSSGSMAQVPSDTGGAPPGVTADMPYSKIYLAKQVLKDVIADNATSASFLFGQYTSVNSTFQNTAAGAARFRYMTDDVTSPQIAVAATTVFLDSTQSDPGSAKGHQPWQDIRTAWNRLYFRQGAATTNCTATIPAGFYATANSLALAIKTAMNGAGCGANTYNVTFSSVGGGTFTIARASGTATFSIRWADTPNNIAGALRGGPANTGGVTSYTTAASRMLLHRAVTDTMAGDAGKTIYGLDAARFFNGELFNVDALGVLCGAVGTWPAPASEQTNPPSVRLQRVTDCTSNTVVAGSLTTFTYAGPDWSGNTQQCNGFNTRVPLSACNSTVSQLATIGPLLELTVPLSADGKSLSSAYAETQDGNWATSTVPLAAAGGINADARTPIGNSLSDIRGLFNTLWTSGQTASAGPPARDYVQAISLHNEPKEHTIVLFVTDGDDTCGGGGTPPGAGGSTATNALIAAYQAQLLYAPIVGGVNADGTLTAASDPASSVTTYLVGFGSGASKTLLDQIAWGGSGMHFTPTGTAPLQRWSATPTAAQRTACTTCVDSFNAPTADELKDILQALINKGATSGVFRSQQSLSSDVYEYAAVAGTDPTSAALRYNTVVPARFEATFELPGFKGDMKAFTNSCTSADGASCVQTAVQEWSAAAKLKALVDAGIAGCAANTTPRPPGTLTGVCAFTQLGGEGSFATAAIKRRIYTTSNNGVFPSGGVTAQNLVDATVPAERVQLWPATTGRTTSSAFDAAMGLSAMTSAEVVAQFRVCKATPSPSLEPVGTPAEVMPTPCDPFQEAREIIYAFMAGAEPLPTADNLPRRNNTGSILYRARSWVLADFTLATPALVTAPLTGSDGSAVTNPGAFTSEWDLFVGTPDPAPPTLPTAPVDVKSGLGISRDVAVMSVLYAAANDMLHAFRAGPCIGCTDTGGEELWGFVPFDQLGVLRSRVLNQPQKRDPHDYMFTTSVRVGEVLVPGSWTKTVNGKTASSSNGAWRRVLYIGRGVAGKYITAIDVTGPGDYATLASAAAGPIPLWSRGNPDTLDGTPVGGVSGGTAVHDSADEVAYRKMGQTWSLPALAYVGSRRTQFNVTRRGAGVDFVAFVGSGYGDTTTEGKTLFQLDPFTGDVIRALDVADRSGTGLRSNALLAAPSGFTKEQFKVGASPLSGETSRIYFPDLHGRMWKVLTSAPSTIIPASDFGADQPVGVPVALMGLPIDSETAEPLAHIYATSGNDTRLPVTAAGYKLFGMKDEGTDSDTTTAAAAVENGVSVYAPMRGLFSRSLDPTSVVVAQGVPTPFRGTVQPATTRASTPSKGAVVFGGTRFNPAGSPAAPAPFPCISNFDSIIYILDADSGAAAFNTGQGDGSYVIRRDSRIVGLGVAGDPGSGSTVILVDEGLKKPGLPEVAPLREGAPPGSGGGVGTLPNGGDRNVPISALGSSVCNNN